GATFVDLTDLYSPRLRAVAREVDPTLAEGVYCQLPGPHYETPAEVAMVGRMGGDLVGMSTALEAIAARHAGLEVLGLSLVTHVAAGVCDEPLSHDEVVAAGKEAGPRISALLAEIVRKELTQCAPTPWPSCGAGPPSGSRPILIRTRPPNWPSWSAGAMRPIPANASVRWPSCRTGSVARWSSVPPVCGGTWVPVSTG